MADTKTSALAAVAAAAAAQELPCNDAGTSKKVTLAQVRTLIETLLSQLNVDNLRLDGNSLSSTDTDGNIILNPDGTGRICFGGATSADPAFHLVTVFGDPGLRLVTGNFGGGANLAVKGLALSDDAGPDIGIRNGAINLASSAGMVAFRRGTEIVSGAADVALNSPTAGELNVSNGDGGRGSLRIGGLRAGIATKTADYTLVATDFAVLGDTTGGSLVFTLPAAADNEGRIYSFKNIGAGINTLTIDGNASELIDSSTTKVLALNAATLIQCNGTAWISLGGL